MLSLDGERDDVEADAWQFEIGDEMHVVAVSGDLIDGEMRVGVAPDDFDDDYFGDVGDDCSGAVHDDFDVDYFGDQTHDYDECDFDCMCCNPFFCLLLIVQHRDFQHLLHILQKDEVQTEKKLGKMKSELW